jgi:hypothetical protein
LFYAYGEGAKQQIDSDILNRSNAIHLLTEQMNSSLASLSYRSPNLITDLFMVANGNKIVGNGAVPVELLLQQSSTAIYTQPDETKTQLGMIGLNFETNLSGRYSLNGNVYIVITNSPY